MSNIDEQTTKLIFKGVRSQKQVLFIINYCNPESDTFDNGKQSYKKAYNSDNDNVSAVEAHGLLVKKTVIAAIGRYKAYLHDVIGFELDWLDSSLRSLFYRVKGKQSQLELRVLKTIGERIGAFTDVHETSQGITVKMTKSEEKLCNVLMTAIADEKRKKSNKVNKGVFILPELDKTITKDLN
jgi:hypothetical protein